MLGNVRCCSIIMMQVKLIVEKKTCATDIFFQIITLEHSETIHHTEMTIILDVCVLWCYKKAHFLRTIKKEVQLCHSLISTNYHTPIFIFFSKGVFTVHNDTALMMSWCYVLRWGGPRLVRGELGAVRIAVLIAVSEAFFIIMVSKMSHQIYIRDDLKWQVPDSRLGGHCLSVPEFKKR